MTWEPRPVPNVTPETAPYWEAAADGRLLLGKCPDCGLVFHPPRHLCPDCFGEAELQESSGRGTIYSYTVVRVHQQWPDEHMPVVLAYVELEEGPRMLTGLPSADPADVTVGAEVIATFEETEDDEIGIPVFELAD